MGNTNQFAGIISRQAQPAVCREQRKMLLKGSVSKLQALFSSNSHISAGRSRVLTKSKELMISVHFSSFT